MDTSLVISIVLVVITGIVSGQGQDLIENTDITFVIDTSGSVSLTSYQYVREFIEDFVLEMNIGPESSRVAVIIFNDMAFLHFPLHRYTDKSSLITAIRNIPYYGGGTNIPLALDLLRASALNGTLGVRNSSRQIAIFLTDGQGGDIRPAATQLAETNIFQLFSVGVDNAQLDQLNFIALNNTKSVYFHSDFSETSLVIIAREIIETLKEKFVVLQPRFGSILGGTIIQVSGNNVEFQDFYTYGCRFNDVEVPGVYVATLGQVLCVSPLLKQPGKYVFCLSIESAIASTVFYCDTFYALSIIEMNEVEHDTADILLLPGNQTTIRWSPRSIIPEILQDSLLPTESFGVDISLYELDLTAESYSVIVSLATNVPNTGMYELTLPQFNLVQDYAAGVIGISLSEQFNIRTTRSTSLITAGINLLKGAVKFSGALYLGISLASRLACSAWVSSQPDDIGERIRNRLPPCPPNRELALIDSDFMEDNRAISYFHPGANSCFRQRVFTSENSESGQQCCYNQNGVLIVGPNSGGTVDLYSPELNVWKHFSHDVLPFIICCKGLFADCSAYYEKRPSDDGQDYDFNPPATGIGDPHLITLDGFKYTFNGHGEFILVKHVDEVYLVQGRMEPFDDSSFFNSATVFTAIAGKQNNSDSVQFEVNQQKNGIDVIVSGERISMDGLSHLTFNNVTVFNLGDNTYAASFSSGPFIKVKEENGFISELSVSLPDSYKGNTRGLLGNFNGDMQDDLISNSSNTFLPHNSSLREIHYQFGLTWYTNSDTSIFTYNNQIGQSWEAFYNPSFRPLLDIENGLNPSFESVCGNDTFCLFDATVTGRTDIGLSTLNSSAGYDQMVELSYPVVCSPPCAQGACVANDTCNCVAGYVGERCTEAVYDECDIDFQLCANGGVCRKLGSSYICECGENYTGLQCETAIDNEDDDDRMRLIIGVVIAAVIVLFIVITLVCLMCCCCHRK